MEKRQWRSVPLPSSLLTDRRLSALARYLFMCICYFSEPNGDECRLPDRVLLRSAQLGSRNTLRKNLTQLEQNGWLDVTRGRGRSVPRYRLRPRAGKWGPTVKLAGSLVGDASLSPLAKWLYGFLVVCCFQQKTAYTARQTELREAAGLGDNRALRTAVKQLQATGWLRVRRKGGAGGSVYEPLDPHFALRTAVRERIEADLQQITYKGELLLKEMLNVLVPDEPCQDNARPSYLLNVATGNLMEFDRWYPEARVAIEFNGPQHYRATRMFSDSEAVRQQQQRDLMKVAWAAQFGTTMVTITPSELTFPILQQKLAGLLPLVSLHNDDPVVRYLDRYSRHYARKAGRGEFTA